MSRFAKLAWATLGYNLLVIVWGAYVRASGSGAGCGSHWPLCNGEVIPRAPAVKTVVELSHRLSSGVALLLAVVLAIFAFRVFERGSPVRKAASAVVGLTVVEALIGAGLVLFELVAHDASMKRALSMVLHLGNTFLLLGALVMTAHLASARSQQLARAASSVPRKRAPTSLRALLAVSAASMMLVGMSGGIAALGDTLFPATSFAEGLRQELSAGAHVLLRLRVLHPVLAAGASLVVLATSSLARSTMAEPGARVPVWANALTGLVVLQIGLGLLNLALLAPVWLQLLHLFVADLAWLALVMVWAHVRSAAAPSPAPASFALASTK